MISRYRIVPLAVCMSEEASNRTEALLASTPPTPPAMEDRTWPTPAPALLLFAALLLAILGVALLAGGSALPPSAFLLAVLAVLLAGGAVLGRRNPGTGWLAGTGVALLGLMAGSYSLVMLPAIIAEQGAHVPSLARAATAVISALFLLRLAMAWRRRQRRRAAQGPLTPIQWR